MRHLQTKLLSKSKFLGFHPIDIYKCKPSNFENMTFYEYFQNYELNKMIHPSFEKYGKISLSFIVYKNEKLVIFIDFHFIHNKVFFTICYYKRNLFAMKIIYFQNTTSINHMYMNVKFKVYYQILNLYKTVATPLWAKCEGEAHTPKSGNLESSGTPKNSELELKGQNTSHWGVLGVIGKALKCKCLNWPRIDHLDICSPSYGQKKGRESNWQFDSRPLKFGNRPLPDVR